jgi:hypothetical protein
MSSVAPDSSPTANRHSSWSGRFACLGLLGVAAAMTPRGCEMAKTALHVVEAPYLSNQNVGKMIVNVKNNNLLTPEQKSTLEKLLWGNRYRILMDSIEEDSYKTLIERIVNFNKVLDDFIETELLSSVDAASIKEQWSVIDTGQKHNEYWRNQFLKMDCVQVIYAFNKSTQPSSRIEDAEATVMLQYLTRDLNPGDIRKLTNTLYMHVHLKRNNISLDSAEIKAILDSNNYMLKTLTILADKAPLVQLLESQGIDLPVMLGSSSATLLSIYNRVRKGISPDPDAKFYP